MRLLFKTIVGLFRLHSVLPDLWGKYPAYLRVSTRYAREVVEMSGLRAEKLDRENLRMPSVPKGFSLS